MSVKAGEIEDDNVDMKLQRQTKEERRLAEMMIPKKKKRLYDKIMYSKKKKTQEVYVWGNKHNPTFTFDMLDYGYCCSYFH